jgi:HSP20 family molecular chaperone IbpA
VDVNLDGAELHIRGSRVDNEEEPGREVRFERSFRVPDSVDQDHVEARLRGGVLRVRLAKREAVSGRKIEVSAG